MFHPLRVLPGGVPLLLVLAGMFFPVASLVAGGGAHEWLVVYDPADSTGVATAAHYRAARGLPDTHLLAHSFPRAAPGLPAIGNRVTTTEAWALVESIRAHLATHQLDGQIHGVALAGLAPTQVDPVSDAYPSVSLTTFLMMSPGTTDAASLEDRTLNHLPTIYRGPDNGTFLPFRDATEIRSDTTHDGERYLLAAHLGYTGLEGLRVQEVRRLIDRSVGSDGTAPQGTVYWPLNNGDRSTERQRMIEFVTPEWDALGLRHVIEGIGFGGVNPPRTVPLGKDGAPGSQVDSRAAQGVIAGAATVDVATSGTLLTPGAIAEHLTSLAGNIGGAFVTSQTAMTEWLRAGASGTAGTVSEPFLTYRKFPHPRVHSHYFRGVTLAEAFAQSIQQPVQTLVMGDPLARPYATVPTVTITSPVHQATVSGPIDLLAATASPVPLESEFGLVVNGREIPVGQPGEPVAATPVPGGFRIETSTLPEGWNDLRVIARTDDPIRSQGIARVEVNVANTATALDLSVPTEVSAADSFTATVQATSPPAAADRIELRFLGRALATLPAQGGTAQIPAASLVRDAPSALSAVALDANGNVLARSAPAEITVTSPLRAASPSTSSLPGSLAVARLFRHPDAPDFDWSRQPDATALIDDRHALAFDGPADYPFLADASATACAVELVTRFTALESGLHDFAIRSMPELSLLVGGDLLIDRATAGNTVIHLPVYLAAGVHELRFRLRFNGGGALFEAGFRDSRTWIRAGTAPPVSGHALFDLSRCAAPPDIPATPPRLSVRPTGGSAMATWSHALPDVTGWTLESLRSPPAVTVDTYLGAATAPVIVPPDDPRALRPGAPVSLDEDDVYTTTPEAYAMATRMITAGADRDDRGRSILHRVSVPGGVTILALIDAASDSAVPDWMAAQGTWSFVAQETESALSSRWRTWARTPTTAPGIIELGGPRRNDGAITFLFVYDTAWQTLATPAPGAASASLGALGGQERAFRIRNSSSDAFQLTSPVVFADPSATLADAPPSVHLPSRVTARAPATSVPIIATVADDGATPPTVTWSPVSGPATATFSPPDTTTTSASFPDAGDYVVRLSADDGTTQTAAETLVTILPPLPDNAPPSVDAGPDRSIHLTQQANLAGSVSDDGIPSASPRTAWNVTGGPGPVTFADATAPSTTAVFTAPGTYTLSLTASDGLATAADTVQVTVAADPNAPPTVNAGPDQAILITESATLTGSVTDDGLPAPPATTTARWRMVAGPGTASFTDPAAPTTTAVFDQPGVYTLELRADDGTQFASDQLLVDVGFADDGNMAPTVSAGADITIAFGETAFSDGATASDDGLPVPPAGLTMGWSKSSGPGEFRHELIADGPDAAFRFGMPGSYEIELTVSDGARASTDTIQVHVAEATRRLVYGWGGNVNGQLGILSTDSPQQSPLPVGRAFHDISPSNQFSMAVGPDRRALASGRNTLGQLGDAHATDRGHFREVPGLAGVVAVGAGVSFGAALCDDGTLWTWGENSSGQLGDGSTTANPTPRPVAGITSATALSLGDSTAFVLLGDGSVRGWGRNTFGQLGDGSTTQRNAPVTMQGITSARAIAAGDDHTVILLEDGSVRATGANFDGQLGDGSFNPSPTPVTVAGLTGVTAIAAGNGHTLALLSDGSVRAWGRNSFGQLGNGATSDSATPVAVQGLTGIVAIAAGGTTSFAVDSDGTLHAWGSGFLGEFGDGGASPTTRPTPAPVPGLPRVSSVETRGGSVLATTSGFTYDDFLESHFTPAQRADADVSGIDADPDRDRRPNLVEYHEATAPLIPDSAPVTIDTTTPGETAFTFTHRAGAEDLAVTYETSTDLIQWNAAAPVTRTTRDRGDLADTTLIFPASAPLFLKSVITHQP